MSNPYSTHQIRQIFTEVRDQLDRANHALASLSSVVEELVDLVAPDRAPTAHERLAVEADREAADGD